MTASTGSDGTVEGTTDLVFAIAERKGVDAAQLPTSLHDVIDTDALDRLLRSADRRVRITFTYEGLRISLSGDGRLTIAELPGDGE